MSAPDPRAIDKAAAQMIKAKNPLIYAGQGVHYAKAWDELRAVAEILENFIATTTPATNLAALR